jgi:uncharacterized hydrophobic protein (TIGR00271 family)
MADLIQEWYEQNRFDPSILPDVYDRLYFEGDLSLRKLTNYVVMLLLATVISTYGVASGSTATVIGAMLVAPLMTPIMGTTLALATGYGERAIRSLLLVVISVIAVIALSAVLSFPTPFLDFENNAEIVSRVEPGLTALAVALAAGAAGAFAITRRGVGDSLPGVAIAISLVPPLSVVGIALSHGNGRDAFGAFLLFFTNFLAIILAGSLVFWVSGANALKLTEEQAEARKRAYIVATVSSLVVAFMLATTSYNVYYLNRQLTKTQAAVQEWVGDSDYDTLSVVVKDPAVNVTVAGSGELAPIEELARSLTGIFGDDLSVKLRKLSRETESFPNKMTP